MLYTVWIAERWLGGGHMDQEQRRSAVTLAARTAFGLSLALCALTPAVSAAQEHGAGNGFLFGRPDGSITFRGGYSLANASGDIYDLQRKQFTIGQRSFDALSLGTDLGINVGKRIDVGVTLEGTYRSHDSEYRDFLDNNNQPIQQNTVLSTIAVSANVKYNFRERGRSISKFAWIPSQYVPYIGAGVGMIDYNFRQKGDFIDFSTMNVSSDELRSSAWSGMEQLFSGVSYSMGPRYAFISEARYTFANAKMTDDYSNKNGDGFKTINLSGLSINFGTSIRF
jgi:opacity protein-like surface antigen